MPRVAKDITWVQHFIHHLPPEKIGAALPNGSVSTNRAGESDNFKSAFWMKTSRLPQPATARTIYK